MYFSFVDPSPLLLNEVVYKWPFWIQNKVIQSCLNTSGCSICRAVGQLCVHSSYYTQKKATLLFSGVFFYVGMRTFSMVLLPVNLDHGGIGTFKGLGFRDLLLGPVNFRDPSSLCLREFLKFLLGKYIKRFRQKNFGPRKGINMQECRSLKIRGARSTVMGISCPPGWDRAKWITPPPGLHWDLLEILVWKFKRGNQLVLWCQKVIIK